MASAIILDDALPGRRIEFVAYGSPELAAIEPEEGILFCDFSPPPDRAAAFAAKGTIVLDHHKTAKAVVHSFEHHAFGDEASEPGVCGAVLAYRHVWKPLAEAGAFPSGHEDRVKQFAYLAGVRDTWQRQSPDWDAACAQADTLRFYPDSYWLPANGGASPAILRNEAELRSRLNTGTISFQKHKEKVARAVEQAWRFTTARSTRVVVFQNTAFSSDAAEYIGDAADLVIAFGYIVEEGVHRFLLSTRSHTNFDCSAFAKSLGGGGHTKAAGCSVPVGSDALNPYAAISQLVASYEATLHTD